MTALCIPSTVQIMALFEDPRLNPLGIYLEDGSIHNWSLVTYCCMLLLFMSKLKFEFAEYASDAGQGRNNIKTVNFFPRSRLF